MSVESYVHGPEPVYRRFLERGRLASEGLHHASSVVTVPMTSSADAARRFAPS
jgi:hypothetical protein